MRAKLVLAAFCISTGVLSAHPVRAQTTDDRVAAESLFTNGRELMQAGKYQAACEKFEASRRLEPALGTTLNLANCYEKLGRTASAWAEFKSAAAEAQRLGDASRKATALERAAALEPKLSRLWLQTADPSISVSRNGVPVDAGVLGNAIPVDPGTHQLEASAPGKVAWTNTVEVKGEGATVEIRIPPLADSEDAATSAVAPADAPPPAMSAESSSTQRTVAWVSGGVGVAGVVTGSVFGLLASSSWSKAKDSCNDGTYGCSTDEDSARMQANVATVAFIVGGVGLGLSTILFLTDDPESPEVALEPTRVVLRGRF
jgi:hypothetical protein